MEFKNIKINKNQIQSALNWLSKDKHNGLECGDLTNLVRYLLVENQKLKEEFESFKKQKNG